MKPFPGIFVAVFTVFQTGVDAIFEGRLASIQEVPYLASLRQNGLPLCGATIIDDTTAITAAHCVKDKTAHYSIEAGSSAFNGKDGVVVDVDVYAHTCYENRVKKKRGNFTDDDSNHYDMAVLRLKEPLRWTPSIKPARLPEKNIMANDIGVIAGWGLSHLPHHNNQLIVNYAVVLPFWICKSYYKLFSLQQFCTMAHATCQGDSGGGFVKDGTLYGVISFSAPCKDVNSSAPAGYANVYELRDFISWVKYYPEYDYPCTYNTVY